MVVRLARVDDAEAIAAIYAPIVVGSFISFEYEPPSPAEIARRIEDILPSYPWLVCERDEVGVCGYAYGNRFSQRSAYGWSVETSIYVEAASRNRRVGRELYSALISVLQLQGYREAFAGIALPNPASVAIHEAFGFEPVGVYRRVGWKFDAWHDVGWWQLSLRADTDAPKRPVSLDELSPSALQEALTIHR